MHSERYACGHTGWFDAIGGGKVSAFIIGIRPWAVVISLATRYPFIKVETIRA